MSQQVVLGLLEGAFRELNHATVGTQQQRWRKNNAALVFGLLCLDGFQGHGIERELEPVLVQDFGFFITERCGGQLLWPHALKRVAFERI